jgi:hypothetical protein
LTAPQYFRTLAKATGPICNRDCEYRFFPWKEALHPGDRFRIPDDLPGIADPRRINRRTRLERLLSLTLLA